ncbi:MAG TPA: TIGR01777 family oxidoreductase [Solirubrobacteraceae bacterium]
MRVTLTGATGLIGGALIARLRERGAQITVLTRDPRRLAEQPGVQALAWDPSARPAPVEALAGRDAVIHLAGEPVAQRWSPRAKTAIRASRVSATGNLVAGLNDCPAPQRPAVLVSSSAIGYYGAHGEQPLDEDSPPGSDFLAEVCVAWEAGAQQASQLGMRVVKVRTGVVLDSAGGALAKMLTPFRLGVGGPVGDGRQYISWIHIEDLAGIMLSAAQEQKWSGPINATAPAPATNRDFSKALGRALHRPALLPVPAAAMRLIYGEMAQIITTGARVLPARALVLGYRFAYPELDGALRDALG